MTKNPSVLVGGMAALVAVGFAVGFGVAQRRGVEESRSRTWAPPSPLESGRRPDAASPGSSRTGSGAAEPDREKFRERIVELETELQIARDEAAKIRPESRATSLADRKFGEARRADREAPDRTVPERPGGEARRGGTEGRAEAGADERRTRRRRLHPSAPHRAGAGTGRPRRASRSSRLEVEACSRSVVCRSARPWPR